jgi:hypothetical protein
VGNYSCQNEAVLALKYEQFLKAYIIVKDCNIKSLLTKIKGKNGNKWLHFAIWDDKDCTKSSAASAILLWISLTGIKGGYLFLSL